jgi:hypothetical protein
MRAHTYTQTHTLTHKSPCQHHIAFHRAPFLLNFLFYFLHGHPPRLAVDLLTAPLPDGATFKSSSSSGPMPLHPGEGSAILYLALRKSIGTVTYEKGTCRNFLQKPSFFSALSVRIRPWLHGHTSGRGEGVLPYPCSCGVQSIQGHRSDSPHYHCYPRPPTSLSDVCSFAQPANL